MKIKNGKLKGMEDMGYKMEEEFKLSEKKVFRNFISQSKGLFFPEEDEKRI